MDLIVVGLYLMMVMLVAWFSRRKLINSHNQNNQNDFIDEQYLAGRSLGWFESMISILATEVSALTFLGIPAFAFEHNFSFLQIYIGAIFGRLIIALIMIPRFYNKGSTVYGVMALRSPSTKNGQKAVATIFSLAKIFSVGVRLYAGSILVAEFFELGTMAAVIIILGLTYLYTLVGGLRAVVRTDLLQAALFITGGLVAHYLIPHYAESSWPEMWSRSLQNGHTALYINWSSLLIGVVGGLLFDMATHGVDQDFTQRLMAVKSKALAQRAIVVSSFFSIMVATIFLGVGALLWSFYQDHPELSSIKPDRVFAHFIINYFPQGMKGLMLAGVLASTMSTLDSTINALSSCLFNDILPHREKISPFDMKKIMIRDNLIISLLLLFVALGTQNFQGILIVGLKIQSWTGGGLLALFFAQLVWNNWFQSRLDVISVLGAYLSNIMFIALNVYLIQGPWQFNIYYGFIGALVFLAITNRLFPILKSPKIS